MNEESKAVNSAAVKPEEIGQEEDTEMFDASESKRFRSLAATLNCMSFAGRRSNVDCSWLRAIFCCLAGALAMNGWPDECDVLGAETSNEGLFFLNRQ